MIELAWWEFEGRRTRLPDNLVCRKDGGFDRRYKVNRDFLADRRWVYRYPLIEMWLPVLIEAAMRPSTLERLENEKRIRFIRYSRGAEWKIPE